MMMSFTAWCLTSTSILSLILNIFIWIQTEDYNFYAWNVIQLKTVATVVGILAILVSAEWLNNKVNYPSDFFSIPTTG
jgi:hypothetical protein